MLYIQSGDIISGAKRKVRKSLIGKGKSASRKKKFISLSDIRGRRQKHYRTPVAGKKKPAISSNSGRRLRRLRRLIDPVRVAVRVALVLLLVAVFILELRVLVFDMPLFRIEQVEVEVPEGMLARDVLQIAGIRKNQSALRLDPEIIEKKIETLPHVKRVNVYQNSMEKVVIEVEERVPVAFVVNHEGRLFEIDEEGFVLGERGKNAPGALPFITGISVEAMESGICLDDPTVREVLGWLQPLAEFFQGKVSEINISDRNARYLYTVDGIKLYLNDVDELRTQLPFILRSLDEVKAQYAGVEYIDLRYKCGLVIKPERGLL